MAIIGASVSDVVLGLIGSTPDQGIQPQIWQELYKLQLAVKELAAAVDLYLAAQAEQQQVEFTVSGTLTHTLFLGSLTTVAVTAGETIEAGRPVRFAFDGTTLRAYKVNGGYADAVAPEAVSAGVIGDFVLRGMFVHPRTTFPSAVPYAGIGTAAHNRLAIVFLHDDPSGDYFMRGSLYWTGISVKQYDYWHTGIWHIGTRIGYVGSYYAPYVDWTSDLAYNALVYFNPRRA